MSRSERRRYEQKASLRRISIYTSAGLLLGGFAFALYKGYILACTSLAMLVFFCSLLGDLGGIRRYLPGLNNSRPSLRVLSALVYVLATLALIGWVAKMPSN